MDKQTQEKIYMAIKSDDEKSFTSFMLSKSDLNLCFGRFPILSLCYLFGAYKILLKYEKYLMPINKFEIVPEYYSIYKEFKKRAKKALRLYVGNDKIVYPIEMLAVLDERNLIKQKYKFLFKNEEILQNIEKIYNLNKQIQIIATRENFECEAQKVSLKQKIIAGVMSILFVCLSVLSVVSICVIQKQNGIGTEKHPIYISTAVELETALKKGSKFYVLNNDIHLDKNISTENFSGTIVGNDKTIVLSERQETSIITNLSGNITSVNFEFGFIDKIFSSSFAVLTQNNTGMIKNCVFFGEIKCSVSAENDVFVTAVAVENNGTIENAVVSLNSKISNMGETNAYLSGIAGKNNGVISNSKTTAGKFESDTVDLAGIVGENHGTIKACENNIELDQISSKEWHPNCGGIAMTNYGTIENAVNNAKITAESTANEKPSDDNNLVVFAGGIACDNYNTIKNSFNYGNVTAISKVSIVFAGGIACRNIIDEVYAVVDKSLAKCDIVSKSDSNFVYAGGVVSRNYSEVLNSGFEGNIEADTNYNTTEYLNVYAGGVVGANETCKVENSYADVTFVNLPQEQENVIKIYGGVIGFIGISSASNSWTGQASKGSGFNYVSNNYYVLNDSVEYATYGRIYDMIFGSYLGFEKVSADGLYIISVENLSDIPEGVRIYGQTAL